MNQFLKISLWIIAGIGLIVAVVVTFVFRTSKADDDNGAAKAREAKKLIKELRAEAEQIGLEWEGLNTAELQQALKDFYFVPEVNDQNTDGEKNTDTDD